MQDGYVTNIGAYYTYLQEHTPNLKSGEEIMMVLEWEGVENAANINVYRKTSLVPGAYVNDVQFIDYGEDILLVYTWKKY